MKKLAALSSAGIYLLSTVKSFAAEETITIIPPSQGYSDLGKFVGNIITLIFTFAVLTVLVMLIWGAFEWITSGGDKEAVGKARNRILNALIGMAVLAVAVALFRVAGQFLGFTSFTGTGNFTLPIPKPQ